MLADFEWFQNAVANLSNDSQRMQVLSEIKIAISALNKSQTQLVAHSLRLNDVFDCLNSSEKEQIELTCDILTGLLSSLDLVVVLGQYSPSLLRAIGHPSTKVKEMVIKELLRGMSGDESTARLCLEGELLLSVVGCLTHDDTSVANAAMLFLAKLGKTPTGRAAILSDRIIDGLRTAMGHNDLSRFRVYELVVEIAIHSSDGLVASQETGLMSALLAELSGPDVLLQLNTIELLTKLALSPHGLKFLEREGTLDALLGRVATVKSGDIMSALLLPGLMKFFGNVAQSHPKETFAQYPTVVVSLFNTLDNDDLIIRGVAMETVGYIGTTIHGKLVLNSLGDTMPQTMKKLGDYITTLPTEWRVRALNTVANLLQLKVVHQNPQLLLITRSWFDNLAPNPIELVMTVCKQPFPELRLAGLQVLLSLAEQPWGQTLVNNVPGLLEYLLDRSQEASKLCKDAKYEIVQMIATSPLSESILSEATLERFREFVRQGPFYVRVQTEVAIEGAL